MRGIDVVWLDTGYRLTRKVDTIQFTQPQRRGWHTLDCPHGRPDGTALHFPKKAS
jgi:hypothetical protein